MFIKHTAAFILLTIVVITNVWNGYAQATAHLKEFTDSKTIQDCWEGQHWTGFAEGNGRLGDNRVWYVHQGANGANTGLDWEDAFLRLEDALAVAGNSDEVWVASGTYTPPEFDNIRQGFFVPTGADLYGGFAGTEVFREERNSDPFTNKTVISGDRLGNDDGAIESDDIRRDDNALALLQYSEPDNTVDGFTIMGGNALSNSGAGILAIAENEQDHAIIMRNVRFLANSTRFVNGQSGAGGAIFLNLVNSKIDSVVFESNSSNSGGAFWAIGGDHRMTNVVFRDNAAEFSGGAVGLCDANLELRNGIFENNSVDGDGGAFYNFNRGGMVSMTDVVFSGNKADSGGAIQASNITLMNGLFRNNEARLGGAIFTTWHEVLANLMFSGNRAEELGGAIYFDFSGFDATLVNLTIAGNFAGTSGGAIHMASLERFGGDRFSNILAYGNGEHAITIGEANDDFPIWRNNLLEGSGGSGEDWVAALGVDGGGNLDADPLFFQPLPPEDAPTTGGVYRVRPDSPALNSGDNALRARDIFDLDGDGDTTEAVPFDLTGISRVQSGIVDMGAFEGPYPNRYPLAQAHSTDIDGNGFISLSEILRIIQIFNSPGFHCNPFGEDRFALGREPEAQNCAPHSSDYNPQDWRINLSEVLRAVQIFNTNTGAYHPCDEGEDGFCVGS